MTRERLTSEERKQEILQKSLEIIHNQGFSSLTIRNIASQIGISEAAIYRHYASKRQIVEAVIDLALRPPAAYVEASRASDPTHLLRAIVKQQMQLFENNPYLAAITFHEGIFQEFPEIRQKFMDHRAFRRQQVATLVTRGQKQKALSEKLDPDIFALIFLGSIRMAVLEWKDSNFSFSLEREGDRVVAQLLTMLEIQKGGKDHAGDQNAGNRGANQS